MQSVSADFTTEVSSGVRFPRAKVDVLWTDPFINSGMIVDSTDYNRMDDVGEDYYAPGSWHDPHLVDTKKTIPKKYLCTDGTCTSDGTYYTVPSSTAGQQNNQVGWHTKSVSDSSGDFSSPPEATVTFANPRSIKIISVVGNSILDEYPTDFDVEIYDESDVLLNSGNTNFSGTSVETLIDFTDEEITDAKYMILRLNQWSEPGTIGRVSEFYGTISDTFYTDDIVSLGILEEREVENGTVPIGNISCNECDIELQNIRITRENGDIYDDPFFPNNSNSYVGNSLTPNVRITPYLGFVLPDSAGTIEYVKMGTFWSNDWETDEQDFKVSVSSRDRLELLREVEFRADEVLTDTNLYDYAEFILNHAKQNIPMNDLVWDIDSDLENFDVPYAWLGKTTYMDAIAKIVEACIGHAYMTRDDILRIETYQANYTKSPDYEITRDEYFNRVQRSNSAGLKNRIVIPVASTELEEEAAEISTTEVSMGVGESDTTVEIGWGDDVVLEAVSEVINEDSITVFKTSETFYPYGCSITYHKATGTSGTFEVKITGKKLLTTQIIEEIQTDQESISLYGVREHKYDINPLLQSETIAIIISNVLLATYKDLRKDISIEWRGNPASEIGDCATIPVYTPSSTGISVTDEFLVYRQQFIFENGLQCKLEGRKAVDLL